MGHRSLCKFVSLKHSNMKTTILLLMLSVNLIGFAQHTMAQVQKRFVVKDTTKEHKDAILILYADKTYLNFGIYNNTTENDAYIWYNCGNFENTDSTLVLKSKYEVFDQKLLLKDIKAYYKRRKDYVLIDSYYEFVKELHKVKILKPSNEEMIDDKKAIIYKETAI